MVGDFRFEAEDLAVGAECQADARLGMSPARWRCERGGEERVNDEALCLRLLSRGECQERDADQNQSHIGPPFEEILRRVSGADLLTRQTELKRVTGHSAKL